MLVGTETYTAKGTGWTRPHWVQPYSTVVRVVGLALSLSVLMTRGGATQEALPSLSLPPISARQITPWLVIMAVGVILLARISTSLCLCFLRLLSIVLALSLLHSAGNIPLCLLCFCSVLKLKNSVVLSVYVTVEKVASVINNPFVILIGNF